MWEEGEERGSYLSFLTHVIQGQDAKDGLNLNLKPASKWDDLAEALPDAPAIHTPHSLKAQHSLGSMWGATQNHHLRACRKGLCHFAKGETEALKSHPSPVTQTESLP